MALAISLIGKYASSLSIASICGTTISLVTLAVAVDLTNLAL